MGYGANHRPDPSDPYYETWKACIDASKSEGLTDDQINNNLQYIYGYNSTTSQNEQFENINKVLDTIHDMKYGRPTQKGTYVHKMYHAWEWDGFDWCPAAQTYMGIGHNGLQF